MSLRLRVLLLLLLVFVAYAAVDLWVEARIIGPSFAELEQDEARKDLARCREALLREIVHLDSFNTDWAEWDDTFAYVTDGNPGYEEANLVPETFQHEGLHVLFIYDLDGNVIWGQARTSDAAREMNLRDFPKDGPPKPVGLVRRGKTPRPLSGIVLTAKGPLLVSARPILDSHARGPARGTLVMGKLLDRGQVRMIAEQTRVSLAIWPFRPDSIPPSERARAADLARDDSAVLISQRPKTLRVYGTFPSISGEPALLLRASVPRDITAKGATTARFSFYSFLAIGGIVVVAMLLLMQGAVIGPIAHITTLAQRIGGSDDLTARLPAHRRDEIGRLAKEFNTMLAKLGDARRELLDQSYYSGMADLAAGVLHNVRNALSPLTVHVTDLRAALARIGRHQADRALEELQQDVSPERRVDLLHYLQLTLKQTEDACRLACAQVDAIARQTNRVEEILTDQERYSRAERVTEVLNLSDVIEESVALTPTAAQADLALEIAPSVAEVGQVRAGRIALLQVLANLLTNAVEAGRQSGTARTRVTLTATREQIGEGEFVQLRVTDDGPGIPADSLPRLFERGFTTKERRRPSGLGLHWSANAMAAMGGQLYAENSDSGRGACFSVIIPAASGSN